MRRILLLILLFSGPLSLWAQDLIPQQNEKGKYGFVSESGEFVIKAKYDDIVFDFIHGVAGVREKNNYYLINEQGKSVGKKYSWISFFDENRLCKVNSGGKLNDKGEIQGGKYGYIDSNGKEIIAVKYNSIDYFNPKGTALVNVGGSFNKEGNFEGGKYGIINLLGTELIKPSYARIGPFDHSGIAWVNTGGKINKKTGKLEGGKYGYINDSGVVLVPAKYTFIGPIVDGRLWVNSGGKVYKMSKVDISAVARMGKDKSPAEIALIQKHYISLSVSGKLDASGQPITGGKFGFVDVHGRELSKIKYKQTGNEFTEDRVWVQVGKKYGYMDVSGKEITKIDYEMIASEYHNGMTSAMKNKKYGVLNHAGQAVTKMEYLSIGQFESGLTWVKSFPEIKRKKVITPAKYGFIKENGQRLTDLKYDLVYDNLHDGMAAVFYDGGWGYINEEGKEITTNQYITVSNFDQGVAWVKLPEEDIDGGKPLVRKVNRPLDEKAQKILNDIASIETSGNKSPDYKATFRTSFNTLFKYFNEKIGEPAGKYGLIDKEGNALTAFEFVAVSPFQEDLAVACRYSASQTSKKEVGFLNRKGEEVIPFLYDNATPFTGGYAAVAKNNLWGFLDKTGKELIPCQYESVSQFDNGIASVKQPDGLWGGISPSGELLIPYSFDSLNQVSDFCAEVYFPGGEQPVSPRQVKVFKIYQNDKRNQFKITSTIPDSVWDY